MTKKLMTWSLVLFVVSMYLPVWRMSIFGSPVSLNVTDVNTSILMQIMGLVALLFGVLVLYFGPSLAKVGNIVVTVIMALMVVLVIVKASGVGFGSGFYLMTAVTVIYQIWSRKLLLQSQK